MKEFKEKLIDRLEEEKQRLRNLKNNCIALSDHEVIAIEEGAYNFCKNIVNKLAEEYLNTPTDTSSEYCEWHPINEEKSVYKSGCENQRFYDGNPTESMYEFCPYCGKKIKAVAG